MGVGSPLLTVVERFSSHATAAAWYEAKEYALPSNCIVPGNSHSPIGSRIECHLPKSRHDLTLKRTRTVQ